MDIPSRAEILEALPLLLLLFLTVTLLPSLPPSVIHSSPAIVSSSGGKAKEAHVTTREEALLDFIAALQMRSGGFVATLYWDESEESVLEVGAAFEALSILGRFDAIDLEAAIDFVVRCQRDDGSFRWRPYSPYGGLNPTSQALEALYMVGALDRIDGEAAVEWVMACHRSDDGGFNPEPCLVSYDLPSFEEGVRSLYLLGALNRLDREKTINGLMEYYDGEEGGFSFVKGGSASHSWTGIGVEALYYVGALDRIDADRVVSFMMRCYDSSSGSWDGHLTYTWTMVETLFHLDRIGLLNASATVDFVLSCQSHRNGGFVILPGEADEEWKQDLIATLFAVYILDVLGALDRLGEDFVVEEEPVWQGKLREEEETESTATPQWLRTTMGILIIVGICAPIIITFTYVYRPRRRKRKKIRRVKRHP